MVFVVFLLVVLLILSALSVAIITGNVLVTTLILLLGLFLAVIWWTDILVKLNEYERAVVFRFGRFVGVRGPGWILVLPFIESYTVVDLRTQTVDVPPQSVITRDNVVVTIDAVIYLRVKDPAKAVLEVDDYKYASRMFVQAMIRDKVGDMTLEELIARIEDLNASLKEELSKMAERWGVEIISVQIENVEVPERIKRAMHDMTAAQKEKEARRARAEAMAIELTAIKEATKDMNERVLLYFYLDTIKKLAEGRSTKIIYPLELSKLAEAISVRLGGVVPPSKIEGDLKKYEDIIKKVLEEK